MIEIREPLAQWEGRGGLARRFIHFKGKFHNP